MNPHKGQYRLGGTLAAWPRLTAPTPAQQRRLRLAYRGLNPWVYSRYGVRQWVAPWPWTRVVVKDPFALLSIPAVARTTGALAIVVYRHPGAVLSSYRRMGWRPDMAEVSRLVDLDPPLAGDSDADPIVGDMARFWTALYRTVLEDTKDRSDVLLVSHEELARGGRAAMAVLASRCGLVLPAAPVGGRAEGADAAGAGMPFVVAAESRAPQGHESSRLHNFNRPSEEVADSWRSHVPDLELELLDRYAAATLLDLHHRRLPLTPSAVS
jgi:hypothetical protein